MSESEIIPITEWPDWNTNPDGGDPLTQDLNAPYDKVCDYDLDFSYLYLTQFL